MSFRSPVSDFQFILQNVVGFREVSDTERFADATPDLVDAILREGAKLCDDALAPLNAVGDSHPARLENGIVRMPPGFDEGFRKIAEGGWIGLTADPVHGGMGLPTTLGSAINEMMAGACLALQLCPLLAQGQIEALEAHGSDEIKAVYLPKLISGEWAGTMNLTEPQAGSDVGALRTQAVPKGDGTYAVTGQKIFISWGDAEFMANVSHLVLARLPDAAPGTKGISLFLVPKFLPDAQGQPDERNSLHVVSLEHKLGIHGSPTAVMEYVGATGWLVGQEHGGMAAIFTMMNNARLGVGIQGIGVAEAACQKALAFARERRQGKAGGSGTIIEHADVRRMLILMKAEIFAARAIALACAVAIDLSRADAGPAWKARAALLTPIAKAFGTDTGVAVASEAMQVHGGMGYIEETGAAQYLRDARITTIYEGTNGIQAMDFVGRKMMDDGEALYRLLDEVKESSRQARPRIPTLAEAVGNAAESVRETAKWLIGQDASCRFAVAVPFLRATARVLGAHYHLKAALAEPGSARTALARFYVRRLLPEHAALLAQTRQGGEGLFDLSPEDLAS
ncbi:MAG: acyl-CoA dehydrogenase [Boseongicola sp. SB0676_bin_33]|uniref:3-methylmercaptopropionyl-CoA dehydrogenase n=1 Tax=Boseongicola sp. SB0664_bin_43 TaxID=2604844 RepID=A0A6B0XYP2_9RHOB|nr:acyl-CoA dehydrogenase [Boseongicola sp. SB0664_bin_43]MYF88005.1 acyl-CoA dehydrogenase [Boseongicola sp. SB0676_bin_33]